MRASRAVGTTMGANSKVNVLLVDDQPARLLTYESILSELGQNLVSARSGLEALEKLMKDEFAVVLLDVSMPDMDGFEAATLIHQHPRFEKTPIIFVTGVHVSELDRLKGYKVGAVDYVSIPVVPEILRSKVAVLVELYQKRRELQELNRSLAQANEQIAPFGEGEERRDHVFIADVADIAVRVLTHRSQGVLNIATGTVHSFRSIAEKVVAIAPNKVRISGRPRQGPMPHNGFRPFDPSAAKSAFPDFAFTPLELGLAKSQMEGVR